MLYLLEARQKLFETERRLVESLRECRNAEIELEKAVGGIIPVQNTER
jgi:outer membrane protein TolC